MQSEIIAGPMLLRKYEPQYAPLLLEAAKSLYSLDFAQYAPWCHEHYSLADAEKFIALSGNEWQDKTALNFALIDAQTLEFCGGIGLNQPNTQHGFYNLGYWVRPSRQRQGIASQATRCLSQAAFAWMPGINRIEILAVPDNLGSQRVALAAGAVYEGLLRQRLRVGSTVKDAMLFSLVR
jgi:RimJ/RimL family protein N-acetyltransferase